jgi:hypothetical protein
MTDSRLVDFGFLFDIDEFFYSVKSPGGCAYSLIPSCGLVTTRSMWFLLTIHVLFGG